MKIKAKQYAQSLFESVDGMSDAEAKKAIESFSSMMIKNNHKSKLEKVLRYFSDIWNKKKSVINAEIVSARELDKKTETEIEKYISLKADGRKIDIKKSIDKSIIGGFIVRLDDIVFDLSLKAKVDEMKKIIS